MRASRGACSRRRRTYSVSCLWRGRRRPGRAHPWPSRRPSTSFSAFRTPRKSLRGFETKRCVNDGAFSLAWEYGTTETVLTSSDDATKKPRIVCSASAKLRPEFARVAGAGRKWDRHQLIGVQGHLASVRNDLVVARERRRAAWACRHGARVKFTHPSRQGPLRLHISHACLPCP